MPGGYEQQAKSEIEHDEIVERFARRLRELRTGQGMTQADLAQRAKVTATYISKLESAGAAPGIDLVGKLAAALGVSISDLIVIPQPADHSAASRGMARELFDALLKKADLRTELSRRL